jgi:hypothetical protein
MKEITEKELERILAEEDDEAMIAKAIDAYLRWVVKYG